MILLKCVIRVIELVIVCAKEITSTPAVRKQKLFPNWRYFVLQNQIVSMGNVSLRWIFMVTGCIPANISA